MILYNKKDKDSPKTKTKYAWWPFTKKGEPKKTTVTIESLEANIVKCEGMEIVDERHIKTDALEEKVVVIDFDNEEKKTMVVNARRVFNWRALGAAVAIATILTTSGWFIANQFNPEELENEPGLEQQDETPTPGPTEAPENTPSPTEIPENTPNPTEVPENTPTPTPDSTPSPLDPTAPSEEPEPTESAPIPTEPSTTPTPTPGPETTPTPTLPENTDEPGVDIPALDATWTCTPDYWTNGSVTVKIVSNNQMKALNGWMLSSDSKMLTKTFDNKYQGPIIITDIYNQTKELNINVKIDKTDPSISTITSSNDKWTNQSIILTTTLTDNESGLAGWAVTSTDTPPTNLNNIENANTFEINQAIHKNGLYYFWSKDNAGNIISKVKRVPNIDLTKPTAGANGITVTLASDKQTATMTGDFFDNESGIIAYAVTTTTKVPTTWITIKNTKNFKLNHVINNNGTYYIWTLDEAGNISFYEKAKVTGIDHSYNPNPTPEPTPVPTEPPVVVTPPAKPDPTPEPTPVPTEPPVVVTPPAKPDPTPEPAPTPEPTPVPTEPPVVVTPPAKPDPAPIAPPVTVPETTEAPVTVIPPAKEDPAPIAPPTESSIETTSEALEGFNYPEYIKSLEQESSEAEPEFEEFTLSNGATYIVEKPMTLSLRYKG